MSFQLGLGLPSQSLEQLLREFDLSPAFVPEISGKEAVTRLSKARKTVPDAVCLQGRMVPTRIVEIVKILWLYQAQHGAPVHCISPSYTHKFGVVQCNN